MAEKNDRLGARAVLFGNEAAASDRGDAKQGEQIPADRGTTVALGIAVRIGNRQAPFGERGE